MTINEAVAKIWHCIVSIRDCTGNKEFVEALKLSVDIMGKYEYEHNKIEKIAAILKTAKADPTRDEYAEYYLDAIEEVVRWIQI